LVALDAALTRLATVDPEQSRLVELRYFAGLNIEETAQVMGISPATVKRKWTLSRHGCAARSVILAGNSSLIRCGRSATSMAAHPPGIFMFPGRSPRNECNRSL